MQGPGSEVGHRDVPRSEGRRRRGVPGLRSAIVQLCPQGSVFVEELAVFTLQTVVSLGASGEEFVAGAEIVVVDMDGPGVEAGERIAGSG